MLKGEGEAGPCGWWCWAFVVGGCGAFVTICAWWCGTSFAICVWWCSLLFMAGSAGPLLLFVAGGVGPCSCLWWCGALVAVCGWWCWALITVCEWWCGLLFIGGGVGASSPFAHGGLGPSFAICGAGHLSFFMGGGAGCSSNCLWVVVVVVHPHQLLCTMMHGPHHCRRARVRVVICVCGHSICHRHPTLASFPCAVITCCLCCMSSSSCVLVIVNPHCCCVSSLCCCPVPSLLLSHVVVAMPSLWHVIWLPCHCRRRGTCVREMIGRGRWAYSPQLIVACVHK